MSANSDKIILSLCDYTGVWSEPYKAAGYDVRRVDMQHGQDVRLIKFPGQVYGIIAQPPAHTSPCPARVGGQIKARLRCSKACRW